ncbi:MAG: LamG domain-containing protein [Sedimentisphaerales bacterium]|nr:LamG domain-containing protein [Sedimentisphaerales bacterium]
MFRKIICLFSLVLFGAMNCSALAGFLDDSSLVIYYSYDSFTDIVTDQSGNGHDGVIEGNVTLEPVGKFSGAAKFETGSYIDLDGENFPADEIPTTGITLAAWGKCENTGGDHAIFNARASDSTWVVHPEFRSNGQFRWLLRSAGGTTIFDIRAGVVKWDEWMHFAGTYDKAAGKAILYIDGELVHEENISNPANIAGDWGNGARVGYNIDNARPFTGLMDDFIMFRRALSLAEVAKLMQGMGSPFAYGPTPADGSMHAETWANIGWYPGDNAASHDVYFSDDFDSVNEGSAEAFQGNQTDTFLVVGFPGFPFPDGLVPGTTYYWRIDEVNDAEPNSPWRGPVWSFMVPPKTAYYPVPADASESVDLDAVLSWTAGFGAKLHTVYFGDDYDQVSNASGGATQGLTTYSPGTLEPEKVYYWRVDEFDAAETYKGDVWSFSTTGAVGSLNPANGAVDVEQKLVLEWVAAENATSYGVYLGMDKAAVRNADSSSPEYKGAKNPGSERYDAGELQWGTTYYWRIDEVKTNGTTQKGLIWSFTTANFLVVDDFESYNDLNTDDPNSNRIFLAWLDGFGDPANGSLVGYENPPFTEQKFVHGGSQAMPLAYDNSAGISEATLTLTSLRDWTVNNIGILTVWFKGDPANAAEQMYVALNGSAIVSNDNPVAVQSSLWTQWNIDLARFVDQGVNLANVNTISLGFGDKNNPQAGGSGMVFFDDIRLYQSESETP